MKKLLKLTALLLVFSVAFASFTACSKDDSGEIRIKKYEKSTAENIDKTENLTDSNKNTHTDDESNPTKTTLKVSTNTPFPPYEYYANGKITGIDIEIAELIAEKLNVELEFVDVSFDGVLTAVENGSVDIGIAAMTVTEDRLELVDFSDIYLTNTQSVIVKWDSDIETLDDLNGKMIGVVNNTTGDMYVPFDYGENMVRRYADKNVAVVAFEQGTVDAIVIDGKVAQEIATETESCKVLETEYSVEEYAIAVSKDNLELLEQINAAITELKAEGKIDEIIARYIQ